MTNDGLKKLMTKVTMKMRIKRQIEEIISSLNDNLSNKNELIIQYEKIKTEMPHYGFGENTIKNYDNQIKQALISN